MGCSREEVGPDGKGEPGEKPFLFIMAGTVESPLTRVDDPSKDRLNQNGSWIKEFTVFLFAKDAPDNAQPLLVKAETVTKPTLMIQANKVSFEGQELREAGLDIGSEVDIYAIANHVPANPATLTKAELMKLTASLPAYKIMGGNYYVVPMSGIVRGYTIRSQADQQINVNLTRAIIRIDVTIVDGEFKQDEYDDGTYIWYLSAMKFYNDYEDTYLWNDGIPASPACRAEGKAVIQQIDADPETGGYPFSDTYVAAPSYVNTNESSSGNPSPDNKIRMKITGERTFYVKYIPTTVGFEHTIDLVRPDGTFGFARNTRLNVTVTLRAKSYETKVEVVPWNVETENPDIRPALVKFKDSGLRKFTAMAGATNPIKFNFDNPAGTPFVLGMFEGEEAVGEPLAAFPSEASGLEASVTSIPANDTGKDKELSFWYKVDGTWYDTGERTTCMTTASVNVLMIGDYQPYKNGKVFTQLGTAVSTSNFVAPFDGLILNDNSPFSKQTGIMINVWGSNIYAAKDGRTLTKLLDEYKIDILYVVKFVNPTVANVEEIVQWLDNDPHRAFSFDSPASNNVLPGLNLTWITMGAAAQPIPVDLSSPIINGAFGNLGGLAVQGNDATGGAVTKESADKAGFQPLTIYAGNRYTQLVNLKRRIVINSDVPGEFVSIPNNISTALNSVNGKFYANIWSWMAETVALGRKHPYPSDSNDINK